MAVLEAKKGGKRKGAGRKPAPYQTKTISFRVRVGWVDAVKAAMNREIERLRAESQ
jgi:hypothetical protein